MTSETSDEVFVHPQGLCETKMVGRGTRVWAFAHILSGAQIGLRCNVCDHVFIENDVIVGDDVTLKCGVQLWDGLRVGNRVFIGPNATFTNDRFPRSKRRPEKFLRTVIEDDVSIGANATILPGLHIGRGAMIGAGAVVTFNVPPNATVAGNPAVVVGFQEIVPTEAEQVPARMKSFEEKGKRVPVGVNGCWIEQVPSFADIRGTLTVLESGQCLPYVPQRIFFVHDVPKNHVRGAHAHKLCEQFLVAAYGSLSVVLDDGRNRREIRLEDPSTGLYLAPMVWGIQYKFDPHSVLMVAASHRYDENDYIRDYETFLKKAAEVAQKT